MKNVAFLGLLYLTDMQMKAMELYCPVRVTMSIKGGPEICSFGIEKKYDFDVFL